MGASFEEKSVWITLTGLVVVFAGYFYVAANMLAAGVTAEVAPYLPVFGVVVALLVVLLSVGHLLAALGRRPEPPDERDRAIACRAENHSSWILGAGVLAAVFCLALPVGKAWIANGLLAALFLAEVAKHAFQLWFYRRGLR